MGILIGVLGIVTSLLILGGGKVLALLLLLAQKVAQPCEGIACDNHARCDHCLATRNDTVATTLLVFAIISAQDIILAVVNDAEWEVGVIVNGALNLLRIFFDDGEVVVDNLGESV